MLKVIYNRSWRLVFFVICHLNTEASFLLCGLDDNGYKHALYPKEIKQLLLHLTCTTALPIMFQLIPNLFSSDEVINPFLKNYWKVESKTPMIHNVYCYIQYLNVISYYNILTYLECSKKEHLLVRRRALQTLKQQQRLWQAASLA